ncbi:hypothetical protein GKZ90_0009735 [Flavobacterium sp. MC2016-06]|uniref:hypothetical protein n=1 Tax=Flavobacterium sp. MC2016-06 TaxID=2676308 RepID=UPI0012BA7D82|nr:hypothetical protein [Flavobacterium sp. MC2016-06]MBU3859800.1 hypothetical protein [Flavobacterium sp. MC2016-06]
MKKISLLVLTIALVFTSCSNDDLLPKVKNPVKPDNTSVKDEESKNLEKMYNEIVTLSLGKTETCAVSGEWDFIAVGSKACGGPVEYLPYYLYINKDNFNDKVKAYNKKQAEFNTKWNITSTCDVIPMPEIVSCVNGKPTLLYRSDMDLEKQNLKQMYEEIITLSLVNSKSCSNPQKWYYTAIGKQICGGPLEYIPYSLEIDRTNFLSKVDVYTEKLSAFHKKWKMVSTCNVTPAPIAIDCVNNKPTLLYESDRNLEKQNLNNLYNEIITLSLVNSKTCDNPEKWAFTAIGEKACGGPTDYIAYSLEINTASFLSKVNTYTNMQAGYDKRWGVISTCDFTSAPKSINCIDGKVKLKY